MATMHVDAAGIRTHLARDGDGAPVVMLHGNPDSHHLWEPVVERLGPGWDMIRPDLPGFGDSDRHPGPITLVALATWVDGLCTALDLDRIHLVAHDFGGPYALAFAVLYPGRIRSITLTNTLFSSAYRWHFWARIWRTPVLGELSAMLTTKGVFKGAMRPGGPGLSESQLDATWERFRWRNRWAVLPLYRAFSPAILTRRVPDGTGSWEQAWGALATRVPCQVLWGLRDPYLHADGHTHLQVAEVIPFPHSGHWLPAEDPDGFTAALADLLGRVEGG